MIRSINPSRDEFSQLPPTIHPNPDDYIFWWRCGVVPSPAVVRQVQSVDDDEEDGTRRGSLGGQEVRECEFGGCLPVTELDGHPQGAESPVPLPTVLVENGFQGGDQRRLDSATGFLGREWSGDGDAVPPTRQELVQRRIVAGDEVLGGPHR